MNMLLMLMLMGGLGSTGLTIGGSNTGNTMQSLLPLMLLSGGRLNNQGTMLTLMTGNPLFMLMGGQRRRYSRRRRTVVVYRNRRY